MAEEKNGAFCDVCEYTPMNIAGFHVLVNTVACLPSQGASAASNSNCATVAVAANEQEQRTARALKLLREKLEDIATLWTPEQLRVVQNPDKPVKIWVEREVRSPSPALRRVSPRARVRARGRALFSGHAIHMQWRI
jgi:hypothetical protein